MFVCTTQHGSKLEPHNATQHNSNPSITPQPHTFLIYLRETRQATLDDDNDDNDALHAKVRRRKVETTTAKRAIR